MKLEIKSETPLHKDQCKILYSFNDKYDAWACSPDYEFTFSECQNKLIHLLRHVLKSLQYNEGLLQLCKVEPAIKLRCYEEGERLENYEILELREMLINCINEPHEIINLDEFDEMGAPEDIILLRNQEIDELKQLIMSYQDVYAIYEGGDTQE